MSISRFASRRTVASRLLWLASLTLLVASTAGAEGRHARLSQDLRDRVRSGDTSATSVILTGSQADYRRPMARGVLNPGEEEAISMLEILIEAVIG